MYHMGHKFIISQIFTAWLLGFILVLTFVSTHADAAERVYTVSYAPGTVFHSLVRDRVKVLYDRAGIPVRFVPLPHRRSIDDANTGLVDGEAGRVPSVEKANKNLVRVNVKLMGLVGAAYTKRSDSTMYTEDLLNQSKVGIVLGVQWAEKLMKNKQPTKVKDYKTLFDMLHEGRVKVAIATTASADSVQQNHDGNDPAIVRLEPAIFSAPIYHYVNKKNEHLVPRLEKALLELQKENHWGDSNQLVFSTFPSEGMGMVFKRILEEAYTKSNYKVTVQGIPAERALVMSNLGQVDGEAGRAAVIEKDHKNLIRVPTPLYTNRIVAFSLRDDLDLSAGWESLKGYKLGAVIGYKFVEEKTKPFDTTYVSSYNKLFTMLANEKVDIAISAYIEALPTIRALRMQKDIIIHAPPLATNAMYHYLHKKNKALVPIIDKVLQEMQQNNELNGMAADLEKEYLSN